MGYDCNLNAPQQEHKNLVDRFTKHLDTAEETSYHTLHGHVYRRLRVRPFTVYLEVLVLAIMCYQYGQMNHYVLFFAFFCRRLWSHQPCNHWRATSQRLSVILQPGCKPILVLYQATPCDIFIYLQWFRALWIILWMYFETTKTIPFTGVRVSKLYKKATT